MVELCAQLLEGEVREDGKFQVGEVRFCSLLCPWPLFYCLVISVILMVELCAQLLEGEVREDGKFQVGEVRFCSLLLPNNLVEKIDTKP
jgi:hypothetical protein